MTNENDVLLSKLAVRLRTPHSQKTVGSGIIYYSENLKNKVYIFTAAHCLFNDGDLFKEPSNEIDIDIYNSISNSYETISHSIDYNLVSPSIDNDVAVLILEKNKIELITGTLPSVTAAKERLSINTFVLKGFPKATLGEELVCIYPTWTQSMTGVSKFQLNLNENYTDWAVDGFSGSGVFLNTDNQLYLFGLFTRYRAENIGKVIYCQYLESINVVLEKNFLPKIIYSFLGQHGLNANFFKMHIRSSLINLGPRFNEKLNFHLPIAECFNDIAKDSIFKQRLSECVDKWLVSRRGGYRNTKGEVLDTVKRGDENLRKIISEWISNISWSIDQTIEFQSILNEIHSLNKIIDEKLNELQELQWKTLKEQQKSKPQNNNYKSPYEEEIYSIRQFSSVNNDLINALDEINITLSNNPILLIKGDAGCGKSHLLGDIAQHREKPTILLLGQFFKKEQTIWQNILNQLHLSCTKDQFLSTLDNIGKQENSRILILIDALNEGDGKSIWHDAIAGFIDEISKYRFIGLVLTIRTTYWKIIVPLSVISNSEITKINHKGFKGNEYEALRLFCEHYELDQPNFPILSPEFSLPLLLQLICEGVKVSGEKKFPSGSHGISKLFNFYIQAVNQKLFKKREEYQLDKQLAQTAIHEVAQACFNQEESRHLILGDAISLFEKKFPKYPNLLYDLILENIFIQTVYNDYKTNTDIEVVYFAYERFGDYNIASDLLKPYSSADMAKNAFKRKNELVLS